MPGFLACSQSLASRLAGEAGRLPRRSLDRRRLGWLLLFLLLLRRRLVAVFLDLVIGLRGARAGGQGRVTTTPHRRV